MMQLKWIRCIIVIGREANVGEKEDPLRSINLCVPIASSVPLVQELPKRN